MSKKEIFNKKNNRPFRTTTSYYRQVKKLKLLGTGNKQNESSSAEISSYLLQKNCIERETNNYNEHDDYKVIKDMISEGSNIIVENKEDEISSTTSDTSDECERQIIDDQNILIDSNETKITFMEELKFWALKNKIPHSGLNDLLCLLRINGFNYLPKNSKTLLNTPNYIENMIQMSNGTYWHHGLENTLVNLLSQIDSPPELLSLIFNIDGLPIANSSKTEFWPILCSIVEIPNLPVAVVAIYCGETKPPLIPYLDTFAQELLSLLKNGLLVNKKKINIKIKCFVCDSPARAFVKGRNFF